MRDGMRRKRVPACLLRVGDSESLFLLRPMVLLWCSVFFFVNPYLTAYRNLVEAL